MMTIKQLFDSELDYWRAKNISLFGMDLIDENKPFKEIQETISKCCELYWNTEKPCKLAVYLNNGTLDHNVNSRVPLSYDLKLNYLNFCIDVYADYKVNDEVKQYKICAIPTPSNDLTWIINNAHYTPRVTAIGDTFSIVKKVDFDKISGESWTYIPSKKEFTCNLRKNKFDTDINTIFNEHLSARSKALLQSCIDEPLTVDNFEAAMKLLPVFKNNSIFNYKFNRVEYFEDIILNSKKYAQPLKNILLGINTMIVSQAKQYTNSGEKLEGSLVLVTSPIFALENFRTVVNIFKEDYKPAFTYTDTIGFFDVFKTATTGEAGRHRLLLDNIIINDGMLWVKKDGKEYNMFEMRKEPQDLRLSCISSSLFCNNNKSKRIMMTAKLTSQAVPLKDEKDPVSHRIEARVGFTDIKGYTYGDSIVISESFAKKLKTHDRSIIGIAKDEWLYQYLKEKYDTDPNYILNWEDLYYLFPKKNMAILDSYENAKVTLFDNVNDEYARLFIDWDIPFRLGDKLSNLHGAKGVVGKIIPDDEMPRLTKKVGNMEPGPLEVIISGFSTIRRGSLGQIFEAWARASGIELEEGEDYISKVAEKYKSQMKKYSENSIVEFQGEKAQIPVGIIDIMRLNHHASIHVSTSPVMGVNFNKMLKLGEMEKFNLVSSNSTAILKELSIRSVHKYLGSIKLIEDLEVSRELPENVSLSLRFAQILKSIGYDILLDNKPLVKSDTSNIEISEKDEKLFNSIEVKDK